MQKYSNQNYHQPAPSGAGSIVSMPNQPGAMVVSRRNDPSVLAEPSNGQTILEFLAYSRGLSFRDAVTSYIQEARAFGTHTTIARKQTGTGAIAGGMGTFMLVTLATPAAGGVAMIGLGPVLLAMAAAAVGGLSFFSSKEAEESRAHEAAIAEQCGGVVTSMLAHYDMGVPPHIILAAHTKMVKGVKPSYPHASMSNPFQKGDPVYPSGANILDLFNQILSSEISVSRAGAQAIASDHSVDLSTQISAASVIHGERVVASVSPAPPPSAPQVVDVIASGSVVPPAYVPGECSVSYLALSGVPLLIGGYSGAGKTTFLAEAAQHLRAKGVQVFVVNTATKPNFLGMFPGCHVFESSLELSDPTQKIIDLARLDDFLEGLSAVKRTGGKVALLIDELTCFCRAVDCQDGKRIMDAVLDLLAAARSDGAARGVTLIAASLDYSKNSYPRKAQPLFSGLKQAFILSEAPEGGGVLIEGLPIAVGGERIIPVSFSEGNFLQRQSRRVICFDDAGSPHTEVLGHPVLMNAAIRAELPAPVLPAFAPPASVQSVPAPPAPVFVAPAASPVSAPEPQVYAPAPEPKPATSVKLGVNELLDVLSTPSQHKPSGAASMFRVPEPKVADKGGDKEGGKWGGMDDF